eukprot:TRINITY_DN91393_c0_g1_i1.p1 TRINITY_DN91393_c0_g1~~TRINITY_DN91393_c0_g1_i1.p1  ORF type:complete len:1131 (+),score=244.08 TRINITY_DN91393_c0_g1_i1:46-3393(+)
MEEVAKLAAYIEPKEDGMALTAKVCVVYSLIAVPSMLLALPLGGISPRVEVPAEDEIWHARTALLLVFSAAVTELCFLAASSANRELLKQAGVGPDEIELPGTGDAWLTLGEYGFKLLTGLYIWLFSGGIVHADTLAWGGQRPVYAARFMQWSVAVPLLVLITNRSFIKSTTRMLWRSGPSLIATFLYVWASWIMEVTPTHFVRWPMMLLSMSGFAIVCVDQLFLAYQYRDTDFWGNKFGMLVYQILSFAMYAAVFLSGRYGLMTSASEQMFYAYCDATVKVLQGAILAMIRNREGALEIRRWWMASAAANKDLRDLLQKARVPVFSVDLVGQIKQWNQSMTDLTGFDFKAVEGKQVLDIVNADCKEAISAELGALMEGSNTSGQVGAHLVEVGIPTSRDAVDKCLPCLRMLAMSFVPKHDKNGELEGVTAIGQDLSDLANMKVVQDRKNVLMAMLTHEIRSPLHGIMGLTEALLQRPDAKPLERQLGMIRGCSARLLDLVTNIMDMAQAEKKQQEGVEQPRPTSPVDCATIVDEAITMIGNSVDKTNKPLLRPAVRLENRIAGTRVPLIRGDHYKITQLIYNFLTNACKFTTSGSITVSARHLPSDRLFEIDIADTGKGISKEGQEKIFKPFQQENEGDTRSFQGIGLGLSVCQGIAELHKGTLRLRSELGQGSTFTVSLPCDGDLGDGTLIETQYATYNEKARNDTKGKALEEEKPDAPPAMPKSDTVETQDIVGRPCILSVDDDEVNQEVVQNSLADFCEVVIAMDGNEALSYLNKCREDQQPCPDLVLLDIQMPGMTGFEVCENIRKDMAYPPGSLPVTMVSAKAPSEQAAITSFDCGSTDFISKPFNPQILKRKVKAALAMKASVGPTSSASVLAKEARFHIRQKDAELKKANARVQSLELEREQMAREKEAKEQMIQELQTQVLQIQDKLQSEQHQLQAAMSKVTSDEGASPYKLIKDEPMPDALDSHKSLANIVMPQEPQPSKRLHHRVVVQQKQIIKQLSRQIASATGGLNFLSARLTLCSSNSKQCRRLLQGAFDDNTSDAHHSDSSLTGSDVTEIEQTFQDLQAQMENLRKITEVVNSELKVMEHLGSNLSGVHALSDLQGKKNM